MKNKTILIGILLMLLLAGIQTSQGFTIKKNNIQTISQESVSLPSSFSWKDVDGIDYTTPIRNLNPIPACEAFALCAVIETMVQYKVGFPFNCDLSEAHLFFCSGGDSSWGVYIEDAADYLKKYGVPDEACFPYPTKRANYPCSMSDSNWRDRTVKITDWHYLPRDINTIKTAIVTNGPVAAYFDIYKDFKYYLGGIYEHRWGEPGSGHWISIIGYNDDPGYWICENSYGPSWGEKGYFRIKYGECGIDSHVIYIEDVYGHFPITYVDDDNENGPWLGTQTNPYRLIQDAINNSYPGYAIIVKNGIYNENLILNKTINLVGEDKENTIIDANYKKNVITITAENVKISGFTIKNSGDELYDAGINLRIFRTNGSIEIYDNIIKNNNLGIYIHWGMWNIVQNNIIEENNIGIHQWCGYNNIIENNTIKNNKIYGISMEYSQSWISANIIQNNGKTGIYLFENSDMNFINNNNIKNNENGILIDNSTRNFIFCNNFIGNNRHAYFSNSYRLFWYFNYWDDWAKILPKKIDGDIGKKINIPWINFDWFPVKRPY